MANLAYVFRKTGGGWETLPEFPAVDREDVSPYAYDSTVCIEGGRDRYLQELERYFSDSWKQLETTFQNKRDDLRELQNAIRDHEKGEGRKHWYHHFYQEYVTPAPIFVDENNYRQAEQWLMADVDYTQNVLRAQRINCREVAAVVLGETDGMDITNYAHDGWIVRIHSTPDCLKMHFFSGPDRFLDGSNHYPSGADLHARTIEGVDSQLVKEPEGVEDTIIPVSEYVAQRKARRSRLIVTPPLFELEEGDILTYTIHLGPAEREMLGKMKEMNTPQDLYFSSPMWSPTQVLDVLNPLFGIIGSYDAGRNRSRPRWSSVFVPEGNKDAVARVRKDGPFWKEYLREDLPVLDCVATFTAELEATYHNRFPPRLTATDISRRLGWEKARTTAALERLAGVLAPMNERYNFHNKDWTVYGTAHKWILPHARRELAGELLKNR